MLKRRGRKMKKFTKRFFHSLYIFVLIIGMGFLNVQILAMADDLPSNPDVKIGNPAITNNGKDMTVNAGQFDKTWIDWLGGFNIGVNNSVNNIGPSPSAAILHNDVSGAISDIQGVLRGNCNVFLLNPNGILFSPTAKVNVGGLVASSLMMSHEDFLAGNYVLKSDSLGSPGLIVNAGAIQTLGKAGVTLTGGAVRNTGVIDADLGVVNLVAGKEVTLNISGDGSIQAAVDKKILDNVYDQDGQRVDVGVENLGTINADGGKVYIETEAVGDVFDKLVNQEGVIKAGSMVEHNGAIFLVSKSEGDKAIIKNSGTLDVSAIEDGADGGKVDIEGYRVLVDGTIKANALNNATAGDVTIKTKDQAVLWNGSLIEARGLGENANGGKVLVNSHPDVDWAEWGNVTTKFAPTAVINTRGGSEGAGDGFIELSGYNVSLQGVVHTGHLLIDPNTIEFTTAGPDANVTGFDPDDTEAFAENLNLASVFEVDGLGGILSTGVLAGATITFQADETITVTNAFNINTATTVTNVNLVFQSGQDVDINAAVTADGTGAITIQAEDNLLIDGAITSGTGNITLQAQCADLGGDTAPVTNNGVLTVGSGVDITSTSGAISLSVESGSGDLVLGSGCAVTTGAAAVTIEQKGSGNITAEAVTSTTSITIESTGGDLLLTNTLNTSGGNGTIDLTASDNIDTNDKTVNAGAGAITFTSDSIDLGTTADTITTTSTLVMAPSTAGRTIGIAGGTGDYNLTAAEIAAITDGGSGITIGVDGGTGAVDINNITFNDNVTVYGGAMSVDTITATGNTVTLDSTGTVTDSNAATNNFTAATLDITAYGGIGSADALESTVTNLSLVNNDVVSQTSNILVTNTGALTLAGAANNDGGNITITTASPLTISDDVTATGNGAISLTSSNDDDITINEEVQIVAELGNISILSEDDILVQNDGTGILIKTSGDGEIDLTADANNSSDGIIDLDGTGGAGATLLIYQAGTGNVDINAADDITITRIVTAGGNVTIDAAGGATPDITLAGTGAGAIDAAGTVTIKADDALTVNALVKSNSTVALTHNVDNTVAAENMVIDGQLRGTTVTLADGTGGTGEVTISTDPNNVDGAITINNTSTGGVDLNANLTANGNVTFSASTPADLATGADRKSTRLNSSHTDISRMPSSA